MNISVMRTAMLLIAYSIVGRCTGCLLYDDPTQERRAFVIEYDSHTYLLHTRQESLSTMKAMIYSTSWCEDCQRMAEYLKRQYVDLDVQLVKLDQTLPDIREKALSAIRKLTWSALLPVTLLDDNVIIGTDYMALIAILGLSSERPPRGSPEHQHGIAAPDDAT